MKHVEACISGRKDQESSFLHCGGFVKLGQACLSGRRIEKALFTTGEVL